MRAHFGEVAVVIAVALAQGAVLVTILSPLFLPLADLSVRVAPPSITQALALATIAAAAAFTTASVRVLARLRRSIPTAVLRGRRVLALARLQSEHAERIGATVGPSASVGERSFARLQAHTVREVQVLSGAYALQPP